MQTRQDGINGLGESLGHDFARLAFVAAWSGFEHSQSVLLVTGVPRLNGAPGELTRMPVLIGESHLRDGIDACPDGVALGGINGTKHAHF